MTAHALLHQSSRQHTQQVCALIFLMSKHVNCPQVWCPERAFLMNKPHLRIVSIAVSNPVRWTATYAL